MAREILPGAGNKQVKTIVQRNREDFSFHFPARFLVRKGTMIMKFNTKSTAAFGLLATFALSSIAPAFAGPDNRQNTKNQWRNLATVGAAIAGYGLLKHNQTATILGAAGAAYSANRYEKDRRSQSQNNDYRGRYHRTYGYDNNNNNNDNNNGYDYSNNGYNNNNGYDNNGNYDNNNYNQNYSHSKHHGKGWYKNHGNENHGNEHHGNSNHEGDNDRD